MFSRKELLDGLSDFKSARDAMLHSDDDDFLHHLRLFVRQVDSNPLCKKALAGLPPFDVDAWWSSQVSEDRRGRGGLDALDLPEAKDAQLAIFLDFVHSFVSGDRKQLSPEGFGYALGKHKRGDALSITRSLVLRPLCEELTRRVRDAAAMTNPDVRELTGVPLERIPSETEIGIFLSHKQLNKDLVRRYYRALHSVGFAPWLDEEDITLGDVLHRALTDGMDASCAAVFFVTPEFKDERWVGREVDLAINRQVDRPGKFQIITLVFGEAEVPRPLQTFVYARVDNDLDGFREIVRALPIELGPPRWKERALKGA
jgi:hypothetical protein